MGKTGKHGKTDRERLTIHVAGKPARILQHIYELSKGKQSYSEILNDWSHSVESPTDKMIRTLNDLEEISRTYFDSDTSKMVELLRPIIIQSTKGNYDSKAFQKVILEFMKSQKRKSDG